MAEREPVAETMSRDDTPTEITPWADVLDSLSEAGTTWLATVRPDGRPHVVPLGALWIESAYYFTMGQGTVKGNNLEHNPHCTIHLTSRGYDLVFEGEAKKVTDVEKLERIARAYADQGWPAYVHDGVLDAPYSAPTTGPAPYDVYELLPSTVFAFGMRDEKVSGFTRYRF